MGVRRLTIKVGETSVAMVDLASGESIIGVAFSPDDDASRGAVEVTRVGRSDVEIRGLKVGSGTVGITIRNSTTGRVRTISIKVTVK
ncbi:hypothetical protein [Cohnella sp.]|uniref:hypothetical protein n=1 Tax=Cohnella sp. TaxID=1883426 RepID=UPI00356AC155